MFAAPMVRAEEVGGDLPFVAHWNLTETGANAFSEVNIAAYEASEVIITDLIRITDFNCNAAFRIRATKSAWTLPADYPSEGAKKPDGSDSDLLLMVDNVTGGYPVNPSEGLAPAGTYATYTAATTGGSDIIGGGAVGANAHGVDNASCDINAKILMDWTTDIGGPYSVTVTLSISEAIE